METKYQGLGVTPGLKSNCRPGLPQRSAGGGRWKSWTLLWPTSVSCQGCGESTWSLGRPQCRFPLRLVGTGMLDWSRWAYFLAFSTCATAPPASLAVTWGSHKVSTQVASHTKNLPFDHGTMVTPSGWLSSALYKPDGSSPLGMFADANERWMTLFSIWWREALPWLDLQLRPWRPNASADYNTGYMCGADIWGPSAPIGSADGIIRPDIRRFSDETGDALSHAPGSLVQAPNKHARGDWLVQWAKRESNRWWDYRLVPRLLPMCGRRKGCVHRQGILPCRQGQVPATVQAADKWVGRSWCVTSTTPSAEPKRPTVQDWRHSGTQGCPRWLGGLLVT